MVAKIIGTGDYQIKFTWFDYGQKQNSIVVYFDTKEDAGALFARWELARKAVNKERKLSWLASAQYKKFSLRWLACFRVIVQKNFLETSAKSLTTLYYRPANFKLAAVRCIDFVDGHFKVS